MGSVSLRGTSLLERLAVAKNRMYRIFTIAYGPNVGEERAGSAAPHKGMTVEQIAKLPYGSALITGLNKAKKLAKENATPGNVLIGIEGGYEIWPETALANYNAGKKPMGEIDRIFTGTYRGCLHQYRMLMMGIAPEIVA